MTPSRPYAVCCIRIDFRPNCGVRLITFFDPGGLDGLQDLLVGAVGIVLEIGQFHHPAVKVREAQVDVVHIGMALLELDRDVLDIGPVQLLRHLALPLLVDHHIAGRRRQLDDQPVERLAHTDLAAQPRGVGEAEGEVEHVLLVLARGGELVEPFLLDHDMAGRAGERALAGALDVDMVAMGDFEHAETERRLHLLARSILQNECHFRHRHSPTRLSSSFTDLPASASRMPRSMRRSANGLDSVSNASAEALISSRSSPAIADSRRALPWSSSARSLASSSAPSLASAASSASRLRRPSTLGSVSRRAIMSASAFSRLS